jgi:putative ABC transport system permease protein
MIRTVGRPEGFSAVVIDQIRQEDPDQPVYDVRTMDAWMSQTLGTRQLMTWLVAFFGGASLLLASLGLYGVISYTSGLRMREFGIRLALGASRDHVRRLVLHQAGTLVLLGCAAGMALAFPVGRAIQSLLYDVTSGDAVSLFIAPTLLIAVAILASVGPATRATRTDPAVTLRVE